MNSSEQISVKNIFEQGTWYHSVDFHDVSSKGMIATTLKIQLKY